MRSGRRRDGAYLTFITVINIKALKWGYRKACNYPGDTPVVLDVANPNAEDDEIYAELATFTLVYVAGVFVIMGRTEAWHACDDGSTSARFLSLKQN